MRWYALDVDYEMSGKDLIDQRQAVQPRLPRARQRRRRRRFTYELFLDEHAQKISKSKGNGLSVDEWLRYAPAGIPGAVHVQRPAARQAAVFRRDPARGGRIHRQRRPRPRPDRGGAADQPRLAHPWRPLPNHAGSPISFAMLLNLASVVNADTPDILWGFIRRYYPDATPRPSRCSPAWSTTPSPTTRTSSARQKRYRQPDATERAALEDLAATLAALPPARRRRDHPERGLRSRQAPPLRRAARLVRLPVSGAARPAGRPALRRLRRAVRHPGDDRPDPRRAPSPG